MTRVGRNDPCPCGSEKKYKNCCLDRDRSRRIRESAWQQDETSTLDRLFAFAQRPAFAAQLIVAFNLFWNGNYGTEGLKALDRDDVGRFMDWYVYDYRLEQSNTRIIELFAEEMGQSALAVERERVQAWQESYINLYRLAGPASSNQITVSDLLQGGEATVLDGGLGRLCLPGDLILGRLLRSSAPPHFSWAAVLLPSAMETRLVSFAKQAYEQHRETRSQASWVEFLSGAGYIWNHCLLKEAVEGRKARRTIGAYYDAYHAFDKLGQAERRLRERAAREAQKRLKEEQRSPKEQPEPLRKTRGGILLPGSVEYKGSRELKA